MDLDREIDNLKKLIPTAECLPSSKTTNFIKLKTSQPTTEQNQDRTEYIEGEDIEPPSPL
jgi:hypothetical protein